MFDYFKNKRIQSSDKSEKPKKDKVFIFTLIFLAGFIVMSLVTGIHSGTFKEMNFGFSFHFSDGAALIALIIAYLIYRIKRGRNNGE